jgi:mRNA interferase MazF
MTSHPIRRGQIWLVNWSPGRGSEQLGKRPALVLQTDAANSNPRYPNTIVVTLSTKGISVATHVRVKPDAKNGLRSVSWVKCEQILTVSKDRLESFWGILDSDTMTQVETAAKTALGLG